MENILTRILVILILLKWIVQIVDIMIIKKLKDSNFLLKLQIFSTKHIKDHTVTIRRKEP